MARYRSIDTSLLAMTQPISIIKASDESVTSSTTAQDDDDFVWSIPASESWVATYHLACSIHPSGDIKFGLTVPSGAAYEFTGHFQNDIEGEAQTSTDGGFNLVFGSGTLGQSVIILTVGIVNSTTAGTVQLTWAQVSSFATASTIFAKSYMFAHRVA